MLITVWFPLSLLLTSLLHCKQTQQLLLLPLQGRMMELQPLSQQEEPATINLNGALERLLQVFQD